MFDSLLYQPLLKTLIFLTNLFGGSLALAIIVLTIIIRTILIPLSLPALKSAQKIREIKPKLDELKRKHGKDVKKLQQAQLSLYKEYGINPASGCLPTIAQIAVLIALYKVFIDFIQNGNGNYLAADMNFFWLDLAKPDPYYVMPILAALTQLILSLMLMPGTEHHTQQQIKSKSEDQKQESSMEMAETIQQQMIFMMPIMTGVIALSFPAGLALYWIITTVFSIGQQYFISGPGGLIKITKFLKKN
jgi:YidC/Oxa1 family membrane protein insertase